MNALSIRNLKVKLGGSQILSGLSLNCEAGKIYGLIGPNGAGKSTLLKTVLGLLPFEGEVEILGKGQITRAERAKTLAYLPQLPEINWPLPVRSIVALGRYPYGGFFQAQTKVDEVAIKKALQAVDGWSFKDRNVLSLSAGERARILLARALAVEAPILLVDEPVASLDPEHQLKVMETLKTLSEQGVTVVIVLHDLTLASRFCDELALLNKGKLVASGSVKAVLTAKTLKSVYKITAKTGPGYLVPWKVTG